MSWGAYWMYYDCKNCGTHYRWTLDYLSDPDFGRCPNCGEENVLVAESKDLKPEDAGKYADYIVPQY